MNFSMMKHEARIDIFCVYHMVQPYFFAHHHLHRRKIEKLRQAGIPSWVISFVPEALYQEHRARYKEAISSGFVKIIRVTHANQINRSVLLFFIKKIVFSKRVLVHVLRTDPSPIITIRNLALIGSRFRYILEYEGDVPSEYVYQSAYVEELRPPALPPIELRQAYDQMVALQVNHVDKADGLVLMSKEHIDLWEARLGRPVNACWLPSLADTDRISFLNEKREEVRARLGITDRLVVTYVGNVICKWQRLDAMCQFFSRLSDRMPSIWFLAIVRVDDLTLAREAIIRHGLENRSTVLHVGSDEIACYLSAADVALFLRHIHPMNTVVTSGKLGEYLAAGLPVITTGANAEVLNEFIRETESGVFLPDSLPVNDQLETDLKDLLARSDDTSWRKLLSQRMAEQFGGENDPMRSYVSFVEKICGDT